MTEALRNETNMKYVTKRYFFVQLHVGRFRLAMVISGGTRNNAKRKVQFHGL